ncbi:MAG: 2-C-methyl-D-erythritol 4-phosphate cytidylyltransferase [Candidatus Marinimicrobia bacterium]|nr:2-C-methyl-D-erythritol 4-phosphate cytidylyltransferase [Candidatus Neomarinimicrobiota bacterium]
MKYPEKKLAVIIPAAGSGKRMQQRVPKPLIRLGDKTILELTLRRFSGLEIHEMLLAVSDDIRKEAEIICRQLENAFPVRLVSGEKNGRTPSGMRCGHWVRRAISLRSMMRHDPFSIPAYSARHIRCWRYMTE